MKQSIAKYTAQIKICKVILYFIRLILLPTFHQYAIYCRTRGESYLWMEFDVKPTYLHKKYDDWR